MLATIPRTHIEERVPSCELCGKPYPQFTCKVCNRHTCRECTGSNSVCVACEAMKCELCRRNLAVDKCLLCGRLMCRECLVEIDEARRICKICAESARSFESITSIMRERETISIRTLRSLLKRWEESLI